MPPWINETRSRSAQPPHPGILYRGRQTPRGASLWNLTTGSVGVSRLWPPPGFPESTIVLSRDRAVARRKER